MVVWIELFRMWFYLGMWQKKSFLHDDYFYFILLYLKCGCLCCVRATYSCCVFRQHLTFDSHSTASLTLFLAQMFGMRAMRYLQGVSTQLEDLIQFSSSSSIVCHLFNIQMRAMRMLYGMPFIYTYQPTKQPTNTWSSGWRPYTNSLPFAKLPIFYSMKIRKTNFHPIIRFNRSSVRCKHGFSVFFFFTSETFHFNRKFNESSAFLCTNNLQKNFCNRNSQTQQIS